MSDTPKTVQTVQSGDPRYGSNWIEIAMDHHERWHWCLWSSNGRPIARSGVAYEKRKDCLIAAKRLATDVAAATRIIHCKPKGEK